MALTSAKKATLKADIAANTNTIGGVQIKNLPNNDDANFAIALWYSTQASPDYFVWRTNVSRSDLYNTTSESGTTWAWDTYKAQSVTEQGAWREMFMGDQANFGQLNVRAGVGKIFTGSAPQNAQRDHCLAVARRRALRIEKLFGQAVANPPANTGNDGGTRGTTTNPDVMGFEGVVSGNDIFEARVS